MRTPIYVLVAALFFGGCTHYHVTPAGAPAAQPDRIEAPEPDVEPLDLDIGRPHGGKLLLQTNRPAYVAIFEIIPSRGVTLIYPAAVHQQNLLVSGLTWVPLWWSPRRVSASDRYIYAVASDEPLRLSAETFDGGYFSRVLGVRIFRAESPYSTMRAISRAVVPDVAGEEWAEDYQIITPTYLTETYRTVRIHCPGGRFFEVPEEMAARIWCPTRERVVIVDVSQPRTRGKYPVARPVRPDSVYLGGRRIKLDPRPPRGPIGRIVDPTGRGRDDDRDDRRGRPARDERDDREDRGRGNEPRRADRDERDEDAAQPEKPKAGPIGNVIKAMKEREKQEREARRREAEEARRRDAEDREARREEAEDRRNDRKDERRDERDERKDERRDERDERKDERREEPKREDPRRDERKDERREEPRREEPKQQGQSRGEEKRDEKREEKQEKREEPRTENRDDNKRRGGISDVIKQAKEKQEKQEKEKKDKP